MENLYYTVLLVLFVASALRIVFKEKGGIRLTIPTLVTIVLGNILFQEQLPEYCERAMLIGVILLIMLVGRLIKNDVHELDKSK